MSRKRRLLWGAVGVLILYVGSYALLSAGGYFRPMVFGGATDLDGNGIIAPKMVFDPYQWQPFEVYNEEGDYTALAIFYLPLWFVDVELVHRSKLAETGRYRVVDYFDWETREYRDVNPE